MGTFSICYGKLHLLDSLQGQHEAGLLHAVQTCWKGQLGSHQSAWPFLFVCREKSVTILDTKIKLLCLSIILIFYPEKNRWRLNDKFVCYFLPAKRNPNSIKDVMNMFYYTYNFYRYIFVPCKKIRFYFIPKITMKLLVFEYPVFIVKFSDHILEKAFKWHITVGQEITNSSLVMDHYCFVT